MAGATATAPAQEAGRSQPQTSVQPQGGPFIRHAQAGRKFMYQLTGQTLTFNTAQPLTSAPGYARAIRLRIAATGGSASATVAGTADAPWNVASLVQLKDAFGTPLIIAPGYEAFYLVPKYGGQFFSGGMEPKALASFSALATASGASAGNFAFATILPFEIVKGIGCISMANAAILPTLQITGAGSAVVYATAPGTLPTLEIDNDLDFYWLPDQPVAPPGLGTTCQWVLNQGNPTIGSGAVTTVTLPREGGYLTTLILELRDATSSPFPLRLDAYGTRIRWYVDGIPLLDTRFDTMQDDILTNYALQTNTLTGGFVRDTGVLPITRKTGLAREIFGLLDTGEEWLSTSPGTGLAVECSPWGTISTGPGTLNVLAGQVVAAGSLVTGLPEL